MSRLIRPCVLLWVGIALVVAGCATPTAVVLELESFPEVHDLAVDGKWLWVATKQGLVRVNQRTLTYEQFSHTGTRPNVSLNDLGTLLVDDQGRLWAGGQHGLVRYSDASGWTAIYTATPVYSFALDADGNFWRLYSNSRYTSIFRYQGQEPPADGRWESQKVFERPAWDDCEAWRFLAIGYSWVYNSPAECAATLRRREQLSSLGYTLLSSNRLMAEDARGAYWFCPSPYRSKPALIRYDGETVQTMPCTCGHVYAIVAAGVKDGVWIGSEEGLFYSDGRTIQQYLFVEGKLVDEE